MINVRDYGAQGTGSHDDSDAVRAALAAVPDNQGAIVYFPPGVYRLIASSATPFRIKPKTILLGSGRATQLWCHPAGNDVTFFVNQPATAGPDGYIDLRDFTLTLADGPTTSGMIGIDLGANRCALSNVLFEYWNRYALRLRAAYGTHLDRCAFMSIQSWGNEAAVALRCEDACNAISIRRCEFNSCDKAIEMLATAPARNYAVTIENCLCEGGTPSANPHIAEQFLFARIDALRFAGNYIEAVPTWPAGGTPGGYLLRVTGCRAADIRNNYFQGLGAGNVPRSYGLIDVADSDRILIESNDLENPCGGAFIRKSNSTGFGIRMNRYVPQI